MVTGEVREHTQVDNTAFADTAKVVGPTFDSDPTVVAIDGLQPNIFVSSEWTVEVYRVTDVQAELDVVLTVEVRALDADGAVLADWAAFSQYSAKVFSSSGLVIKHQTQMEIVNDIAQNPATIEFRAKVNTGTAGKTAQLFNGGPTAVTAIARRHF